MNDQPRGNQSDDYDEDRTRIASHRRPGQSPRQMPHQVAPQPFPPQPVAPQGPPQAPVQGGFSDDPGDRTNVAGPVRFQPTPIPPGQADRRRRRGVILVVALALLLIAGAIVGILMLANSTDQSDDKDQVAPPEPGVLSYHEVVAEVEEDAKPSADGNMVARDRSTGDWVELGPAVLDVDDVEEATAEFNDTVQRWVVSVEVKDEAMADYRKFNEDAACAKDELGKRVGNIVDGELVNSVPTNIPCGTDLSEINSVVINGGFDEAEARDLADKINDA